MKAQFKKGVIELCILELINANELYGYKIVNNLSEFIETKENTVYPILHRLTKDKCLESYLKESDGGPARKYYKLTTLGKTRLKEMKSEWIALNNSVNLLIKECESNE